jgi:hypothetical protein
MPIPSGTTVGRSIDGPNSLCCTLHGDGDEAVKPALASGGAQAQKLELACAFAEKIQGQNRIAYSLFQVTLR